MHGNIIRLELPLKYPETIRVTFEPDFPGPLTIEIVPSTTATKPQDTPRETGLSQLSRTFIGPGIDVSPIKTTTKPSNVVGKVISRPPTPNITNLPVPSTNIDDSLTEPESEEDQGALGPADKTLAIVNAASGIKRPGSPLFSNNPRRY
ncbi:hypothetical protein P692DRAFT_20741293 [Suillus brevipes Sb2]|nr:hypothetical protein P692DRAFT_20741293 [Suillus brevipes Sb2]